MNCEKCVDLGINGNKVITFMTIKFCISEVCLAIDINIQFIYPNEQRNIRKLGYLQDKKCQIKIKPKLFRLQGKFKYATNEITA